MLLVLALACAARKEPVPEPFEPDEPQGPDEPVVELPPRPEFPPEQAPPGSIRRLAVARLEGRSGSSMTGTVTFQETVHPPRTPRDVDDTLLLPPPQSVRVIIEVRDAPPGLHGVHVHEEGDCSAPDASSAGGHFNPEGMPHGDVEGPHHPGDFGNLTVGGDGRGHRELTTSDITLGPGELSVVGRAVLVHERPDDFSQPNGNAGRRIACGVILSQVALDE